MLYKWSGAGTISDIRMKAEKAQYRSQGPCKARN